MKKINILLLCILSQILINCTNSNPGDDSSPIASNWTTIAFTGDGFPINLCSNGTNLFVGTITQGVYRSTDNGDTWTIVNNGIIDKQRCEVFSIGGTIYVSTTILNIGSPSITKYYKSVDNGNNWVPTWTALKNTGYSLPESIFLFGSTLVGSTSSRFYSSINNGVSWSDSPIESSLGIRNFASDGTSIFASAHIGVLYKSTGGSAFNYLNTPSTLSGNYSCLTSLGTKIFIGDSLDGEGVYVSSNSGNDWSPVNQGLGSINGMNKKINVLNTDGTNLYVGTTNGVYISKNGGVNWTQLGGNVRDGGISHVIKNGGFVFAFGGDFKLYRIAI